MKLFAILYNILVSPIILIATIITAVITIIGCTFGNSNFWGYYPGRIWGKFMCWAFFIPVEIEGGEHLDQQQSYIFVANHQGAYDIFLIYGYLGRNFKWVMKGTLRKIIFVGKACEAAGHIFVGKGPKSVAQTIAQAEKVLIGGTSIVIFPEGARTFTGHMGYFKRGAFQQADDLQLPVVPLTINGAFNVMPRTSCFVRRHPIKLTIHKPIPPKGKGTENIKAMLEEAYTTVEKGLVSEYQGMIVNKDQEVS